MTAARSLPSVAPAEPAAIDRVLIRGAYGTTLSRMLGAAASERGLYLTYGPRFEIAHDLRRAGLLAVSGGWFSLTERGRAVLNELTAAAAAEGAGR